MAYVTDQTSEELRQHMKNVTSHPNWNDPLVMRLWKEVQEQDELIAEAPELKDIQAYCKANGLVMVPEDAYRMAQKFHSIYERIAPDFDYETRESSAVAWGDVPENNRNLMVATCIELISAFRDQAI